MTEEAMMHIHATEWIYYTIDKTHKKRCLNANHLTSYTSVMRLFLFWLFFLFSRVFFFLFWDVCVERKQMSDLRLFFWVNQFHFTICCISGVQVWAARLLITISFYPPPFTLSLYLFMLTTIDRNFWALLCTRWRSRRRRNKNNTAHKECISTQIMHDIVIQCFFIFFCI